MGLLCFFRTPVLDLFRSSLFLVPEKDRELSLYMLIAIVRLSSFDPRAPVLWEVVDIGEQNALCQLPAGGSHEVEVCEHSNTSKFVQ